VRRRLGHSVRADESVATAIHLFVRHVDDDLEALVESCVELGGDVDTIAAMAGALLGAYRGSSVLPEPLLARLDDRERIENLGRALHDARPRPR
jgi:poly(ADP-ribose) glycohydrolase ARH3